ncbi:type III PLP-dependent enzyme [Planosporangium flavigriseum]|uniref:Staphyloferrin B biosynthesis decarboxylase SbnH n=1 Tax=Planosporangium flavigriseum TaxID=373681 RepID=A0A8J3PP30_9ACTN|nr:alanine racemase [Planosporangium flavigriseum]NJC67978.1 type III PLP-dependent enzyme [Planosporangium flavigriseum]GIG76622.1 staphyloferrin B biosynthesis decarboxylase SbnH [Planosporangium flavigriseum]
MIPPDVLAALRDQRRPVCAYVYDLDVAHRTVDAVRAALPPGALLLYAVKANSHPGVVAALARHVDGLEVASGGELELAAGTGASTIVFGGPAKTDAELSAAVAAGALVHAESLLELRRLAAVAGGDRAGAGAGDRCVRVALRVNRAGVDLAGSHRMTGVPTQFGIDEAALGDAVALVRELPALRLVGFGLHAVSNNLDAVAHAAYVADALDWSVAAARRLGVPLEYVNVGGGLGLDYAGDKRFDLDALRAGLAGMRVPRGVTLAFEPGRFLVASAGWYAAEVLDLKRTHGRWFAVLRGGTHHFRLPAAWGYSHPAVVVPVEDWPYPFERPEVRDAHVDVVGELCTPRDVLARELRVDRLRVGDVLVFGNTGGYGWDISHRDFLRHPYPQIVLIGE